MAPYCEPGDLMNREELRKYIGITGYSLGQVEKDYFQHMILGALSRKSGGELVFKGGTALQKTGVIPRFSEDLDFTKRKEINLQGLIKDTLNVIKNYNFQTKADKIVDDERTMGFRIKIQGPLYRNRRGICTVRVEVSKREKVILDPERRELTPPYSDILPYLIYIMQKEEILSEKIRAVYTRHRARDLYDIYKILERGPSSISILRTKNWNIMTSYLTSQHFLVTVKGLKYTGKTSFQASWKISLHMKKP